MTQDERVDPLELLSSFLDGEPVEPEALGRALAAPGGREALLDFARLRAVLAEEESRPSPAFYDRVARTLGRGAAGSRGRGLHPSLRRLAAVVVLALAGLGAADLVARWRGRSNDEPPRATRVLRFTPGVDWHSETH